VETLRPIWRGISHHLSQSPAFCAFHIGQQPSHVLFACACDSQRALPDQQNRHESLQKTRPIRLARRVSSACPAAEMTFFTLAFFLCQLRV
jgi:hypothetical protein